MYCTASEALRAGIASIHHGNARRHLTTASRRSEREIVHGKQYQALFGVLRVRGAALLRVSQRIPGRCIPFFP